MKLVNEGGKLPTGLDMAEELFQMTCTLRMLRHGHLDGWVTRGRSTPACRLQAN